MRNAVEIRKETKPSQKGKKSRNKKRKLNTKRFLTVLIVAFFSIYFVYIMIWQQITISRKDNEIKALEEQITAATQQTEKLQQELDNLNDPEYLEKIAREKLNLVLPNERIFVDANKSNSNNND